MSRSSIAFQFALIRAIKMALSAWEDFLKSKGNDSEHAASARGQK